MSPTLKVIALGIPMHMESFSHDTYKEEYIEDEDLKS
jgi:hypothetical protein